MFPHPIGGIILGQYPKQKHIYVGVDLHKHKHVAVIIDCWHEKMGNKIEFDNKPSGFDEFVQSVKKRCKRGITPIFGLEYSDGYGRDAFGGVFTQLWMPYNQVGLAGAVGRIFLNVGSDTTLIGK